MKTMDVTCPICGTVNHNLYLEETGGWMECEHCGNVTCSVQIGGTVKIPEAVRNPPTLWVPLTTISGRFLRDCLSGRRADARSAPQLG